MFNLDTCVAFIASNASKEMDNYFNQRLISLGCTRVQWIALYYLGQCKSINQRDLAKKLNIKSSTVVKLVDRMERDGYLKRVKDLNDKRVTTLKLTQKGMKLREELLSEGEKTTKIFCQNVTDEELEIFINVLNKIVHNINTQNM